MPQRRAPQRRTRLDRGLLRRTVWAFGQLRAGRPLKATDVARTFEVSTRTAYRDLDYLRDDMHVPIAFDRSRRTFFLTEPTVALAPVTISRGEAVAPRGTSGAAKSATSLSIASDVSS
jgi:predicted DNA-binding transcriptional regulator YafY